MMADTLKQFDDQVKNYKIHINMPNNIYYNHI